MARFTDKYPPLNRDINTYNTVETGSDNPIATAKTDFYDDIKELSTIPTRFVNPSQEIGDMSNLIWVEITGIPIFKLTNNVRAQCAYSTETDENKSHEQMAVAIKNAKWYYFKFLAQQDLMETINHSWEPYDSVASQIAGFYAKFGISLPEQAKGLSPIFRQENVWKGMATALAGASYEAGRIIKSPDSLKTLVNDLTNWGRSAAVGGYVANYRVDTPLQYKGSERRQFDLIFNLINTKEGKNHEQLVLPVKLLEMLSTPSYNYVEGVADQNFNADIILPYLFSLRTAPGDLLTVDLAVLKSVQPTWKGPWIDGYPSRCELRLTFTEYRPLEQGVFYGDKQSKINVTERSDANRNADPKNYGLNSEHSFGEAGENLARWNGK